MSAHGGSNSWNLSPRASRVTRGPVCWRRLFAVSERLVLDSSERDDRHGALLDADMTADALILTEQYAAGGRLS